MSCELRAERNTCPCLTGLGGYTTSCGWPDRPSRSSDSFVRVGPGSALAFPCSICLCCVNKILPDLELRRISPLSAEAHRRSGPEHSEPLNLELWDVLLKMATEEVSFR